MRIDFSHLVVMKHVVTAIIVVFEFPGLIELEKEGRCDYWRGPQERQKRWLGNRGVPSWHQGSRMLCVTCITVSWEESSAPGKISAWPARCPLVHIFRPSSPGGLASCRILDVWKPRPQKPTVQTVYNQELASKKTQIRPLGRSVVVNVYNRRMRVSACFQWLVVALVVSTDHALLALTLVSPVLVYFQFLLPFPSPASSKDSWSSFVESHGQKNCICTSVTCQFSPFSPI